MPPPQPHEERGNQRVEAGIYDVRSNDALTPYHLTLSYSKQLNSNVFCLWDIPPPLSAAEWTRTSYVYVNGPSRSECVFKDPASQELKLYGSNLRSKYMRSKGLHISTHRMDFDSHHTRNSATHAARDHNQSPSVKFRLAFSPIKCSVWYSKFQPLVDQFSKKDCCGITTRLQ